MNYRYITKDIIDSGSFFPDCAEASAEAERYNADMKTGHRVKAMYMMYSEMYTALHIMLALTGLPLLINILTSRRYEGITGMAADMCLVLAFLFILMRYAFVSPFSFRWNVFSGSDSFSVCPCAREGKDRRETVIWSCVEGMIILGVIFLPMKETVSRSMSAAAFSVHLLILVLRVLISGAPVPALSVIAALIPALVSPALIPLCVLCAAAAVIAGKKRRIMADMDGAPDFRLISVKFNKDGIKTAGRRRSPGSTEMPGMAELTFPSGDTEQKQ